MNSDSMKEDSSVRKRCSSSGYNKRPPLQKDKGKGKGKDLGKVHNFFVFIGNRADGNHNQNSYKKGEKINTLGDSTSNQGGDSKKRKRGVNLASLMKKKPASRGHSRKKSIKGISHLKKKGKGFRNEVSTHQSSPTFIEDLSSKIEDFTLELKKIRKDCEERKSKRLNTPTNIKLSDRSDTTLKAMGKKNDFMNHYQLQSTKLKTEKAINEINSTLNMISEMKPETKAASCQTQDQPPEQISFSNLNMMNLMKEVAKEILIKSKGMDPNIENIKEYFEKIGMGKSDADTQKQAMINSIFNFYQEQLIFEEALTLLQDKGVDLENLFIYAYERLKIKVSETEREDKTDRFSEPSFTVVTDASLASLSQFEDSQIIDTQEKIYPKKEPQLIQDNFHLDFGKLDKDDESSDE